MAPKISPTAKSIGKSGNGKAKKPEVLYPPVDHRKLGFQIVAGVDEVGRGCLAGPVYSAAVILCPEFVHKAITDSKLLTADKRHEFAIQIKANAKAWAIGIASVEEIEQLNILHASLLSMRRAIEALTLAPELVVLDGNQKIRDFSVRQLTLIKGDLRCLPVSCASIIAKVARDEHMESLEKEYPGYEFAQHKGYATPLHRTLIRKLGPSKIHRKSFIGVREHLEI